MIVVVTGSRHHKNVELIESVLAHNNPTLVIVGGAKGADIIAEGWARKNEVPVIVLMARWDVEGKAAGMIRNRRMLDLALKESVERNLPARVLAFPLPGSVGTMGCMKEARLRGIEVICCD